MHYWVYRWFPKRALSKMAGWLAGRHKPRWLLRLAIGWYIRAYRIDMSDFAGAPESFETFNAFFARPLRRGQRPVDSDQASIVSPVDGRVGESGKIWDGRLIQAKGMYYGLADFLAEDEYWTDYLGGLFVSFYLAPPDYHRIHAPTAGTVRRFRYVPGEYWSVGPRAVAGVPRLYQRNERLVTFLEGQCGTMALVAVGAMIVGGIRAVYHRNPAGAGRSGPIGVTLPVPHTFEKGAELGRFELGSSVVLLMRKGETELRPFQAGEKVRMGQVIGKLTKAAGS